MPKSVHAVIAEIDRRLAAAGAPGRLSAADLRHRAADYLRDRDARSARSQAAASKAHWNLWMTGTGGETAAFAVLAFDVGGIEFFCGSGCPLQIRMVSEREAPDDPAAVYPLLRNRFAVADEPLKLDRRAAEAWLGRPRPW